MSLVKKCQVCNKLEFILYKLNHDHHCPICTKKSINIDYLDNVYTYCYCNECNIAYRYNNKKKHHILHKYGNFYYAEVIEKYCTKGYNVNYMPMFKDEIYFKKQTILTEYSYNDTFCVKNKNILSSFLKFEYGIDDFKIDITNIVINIFHILIKLELELIEK